MQVAVAMDAVVFVGGLVGALRRGVWRTAMLSSSTSRNGSAQVDSYYLQLNRSGCLVVALAAAVVGLGLAVLWNHTRSSWA